MSETSYFRIQRADLDVNDLLDPGYQFSSPVNGSKSARGVSVCDSLDDLALYLADPRSSGVMWRLEGWDKVIVELEGQPSGDAPCDPELESLIIPSRIISVTPVGEAFMDLIQQQCDFLASFVPEPDFDDED